MERKTTFAIGEYYHLYNRGTEKRKIFLETRDYQRFIVLLHLANNKEVVHISNQLYQGRSLMELLHIKIPERLVALGAYCLMPNHFHLLVKEQMENGISLFMKKLLTGYSMYFNKKYERNGSLFQGRFKSEHADNDQYLQYLFAYIHLNPVKLIESQWKTQGIENLGRVKKFLHDYTYSSYQEHNDQLDREERVLLNCGDFPEYFQTKKESLNNLYDWLNIKDRP